MRAKEKILWISILSFSNNVFYSIKTEITISDALILSSAIVFKLVKSKMPLFGKGLIDGKSIYEQEYLSIAVDSLYPK